MNYIIETPEGKPVVKNKIKMDLVNDILVFKLTKKLYDLKPEEQVGFYKEIKKLLENYTEGTKLILPDEYVEVIIVENINKINCVLCNKRILGKYIKLNDEYYHTKCIKNFKNGV